MDSIKRDGKQREGFDSPCLCRMGTPNSGHSEIFFHLKIKFFSFQYLDNLVLAESETASQKPRFREKATRSPYHVNMIRFAKISYRDLFFISSFG